MTEGPQLYIPEYETVNFASGPLVFFDRVAGAHYNEVVEVITPDGERRRGQVLEVDHDRVVVEVFAGTRGIGLEGTRVRLGGEAARLGGGMDMLGRMLEGAGKPHYAVASIFP